MLEFIAFGHWVAWALVPRFEARYDLIVDEKGRGLPSMHVLAVAWLRVVVQRVHSGTTVNA